MEKKIAEDLLKILGPYMKYKRFAPQEVLWHQGDENGMLVHILRGTVKVCRYTVDGHKVLLYLFGPGTTFGFMPLLDGKPYPACAEADNVVEAQVISRHDFTEVVARHPQVCRLLLQELSLRLREAMDQIERRSIKGTVAKVAAGLSSMVPKGRIGDPTVIVALPVSASDYANLLGISPESLSRALTYLDEKEVIHRLGGNRFQVLDARELIRLGKSVPVC